MVWAAKNVKGLLSPYFFEQNVNADSYLRLLNELRVTLSIDEQFPGLQILFL